MDDKRPLDEIRQQIQESLAQAKRDLLRDEFDMQANYVDPRLSPEGENKWLDYLIDFERQFETASRVTVRERIGNPSIQPIESIPIYALEEAVNELLELLGRFGVVVDFMGNWDDLAAYRYLTETLLDEEMEDIKIEGMLFHFDATTLEYDVEMWVEIFVGNVFWQKDDYFLEGLQKQSLFDEMGAPMPTAVFVEKLEAIWAHIPAEIRAEVVPIVTQVVGEEGTVTAVITWQYNNELKKVESTFQLQPSPYHGWDVVYTSLLDDLLALL